jgi:hypothetical protein
MPFLVFKLVFVALAAALLAILLLVGMRIWRARQSKAVETAGESRVAELASAVSALAETAAQPEAEALSPAPMRRRQLQSFAENERLAEEAEAAALLPLAPTEPGPAPAEAGGEASEPQQAYLPEQESEFDAAVLARLEEAFDALQSGEISLEAYRERLLAEQATVEERVAVLETGGDSEELDAALAAQESVEWCLNWAAEQEAPQER